MTEVFLCLVLVGAALDFGAVTPGGASLMELFVLSILALHMVGQAWGGKFRSYLPIAPTVFLVLAGLQVLPLPWFLLVRLSPERALGPRFSALSTGPRDWSALSVNTHLTSLACMKILAYFGGFMLAAESFDSARKSKLALTLVGLGCFEAVYGIIQSLTGWRKIFGYTKQYYVGDATGTYINHNHFAGVLELTLPFVCTLLFFSVRAWSGVRHRRTDWAPGEERSTEGSRWVFYLFLLVLMVLAVVLSHSRAGILITMFTIFFIALLAQAKIQRKTWVLATLLFLACAAGYSLWIGLGPLLSRFEQMGAPGYFEMEGRVSVWRDALGLIRDYPLFGTGLGTFAVSFKRYQTSLVNFFVEHAHNDYLEFACETGLLGAALLFLPILYLLARMIVCFLHDSAPYRCSIMLGCIGSTLAILLHSVVDFNLQIPANALIFAVVLGMGYKMACIEWQGEGAAKDRRSRIQGTQGSTP